MCVRNMLHGPWKEAGAPVVALHVDDKNVNDEAIAMALAYLYGHHPKLNDNNAFRVLAGLSFADPKIEHKKVRYPSDETTQCSENYTCS